MFRFNIEIRNIQKVMANAMKIIDKKCTIQILDSIWIGSASPGNYQLIAANTDHTLIQDLAITPIEGDFKDFCVQAQGFWEVVSSAPGDVLRFTVDLEGNTLKAEYLNGHYSFPISPAEEFPQPRTIKEDMCHFTIPAADALPAIKSAYNNCVETELRPVMSAIYFDAQVDGCTIVGSEGHTLMKKQFQFGAPFIIGKPMGMMVPRSLTNVILSTFSCADELLIRSDESVVEMEGNGAHLIIQTIEGRYPNYNSVIPKNNPINITINKKLMIEAIRRVAAFSSQASNMVVFKVHGDRLYMKGFDTDYNRAAEEYIDMIENKGAKEGYMFGAKAAKMITMIGTASQEEVTLQMSDPSKAIVMQECDQKSVLTMLVMPMLVE